jgi:16S rRNA (guanine527-N7)-methyltransferase
MAAIATIAGPAEFGRVFAVSRETAERLEIYEALLQRWQSAVNLVAPSTLMQVWHRHFADSAQLAASFPAQQPGRSIRHADLGSGGGFPGLVLAIMFAERGDVATMLIESDQRKSAFLREVARQTGIAVEIVTKRIEIPETRVMVKKVDVVTARALAPLDRLFDLSAPFCSASTTCLFLKGRGVEQELADAGRNWRFHHRLAPSITQAGAYVVEVRHLLPA